MLTFKIYQACKCVIEVLFLSKLLTTIYHMKSLKRISLVATPVIAAIFAFSPSSTQAANLPTVGSYAPVSGIVYSAVSDNKMMYLGTDKGLLVIDVSNKKKPRFRGMLDTHRDPFNSIIHGIAISGNYVYADLREYGGLAVIDASDPTHPQVVGSYYAGDHVWFDDIKVVGDRAYLYGSTSLVDVVNIADPRNPTLIKRLNLSSAYMDIDVAGNYLYSMNTAGAYELSRNQSGLLEIYNIADLEAPILLSTTSMKNRAASVNVEETIAYIDDGTYFTVVDVSDPTLPKIIGSHTKSNSWGFDVTIIEQFAVLRSGEIFDITNPAKPVPATGTITGSNHYIYIPAGMVSGGALASIIDIKNTASPTTVSTVSTNIIITDVVYDPKLSVAYAIDPVIGLHILDTRPEFQDVGYMYLIDLYDTQGAPQKIQYYNELLFIATEGAGLQIVDPNVVLNAGQYEATPKRIGSYTKTRNVWDMDFSSHYVMLAAGTDGLVIIDAASNTYAKVGQYYGNFDVRTIEIRGTIAYLGLKSGRIIAVDITDPTNPFRLGSTSSDPVSALSVRGRYLYTTNKTGLTVYSLNNPKKPKLVKIVNISGSKNDLLVTSANRAYIANGTKGIVVYNVSNPNNIKKIKTIPTPGMKVTGLSLKGKSLVVAGGSGGIRIIDLSGL